jgi:hypothetical protein
LGKLLPLDTAERLQELSCNLPSQRMRKSEGILVQRGNIYLGIALAKELGNPAEKGGGCVIRVLDDECIENAASNVANTASS